MTNIIYTVYKTTNLINNKIYIGVHETINPNDSYIGSGLQIKRAVKKHGKTNFSKEILFECDNSKEAYLIEFLLVDKEFINRNDTYNIAIGGNGGHTGNYKFGTHGHMNSSFGGLLYTPTGIYESSLEAEKFINMNRTTILKLCKNNESIITKEQISRNRYLYSLKESPVGKTYKELGFYFESK